MKNFAAMHHFFISHCETKFSPCEIGRIQARLASSRGKPGAGQWGPVGGQSRCRQRRRYTRPEEKVLAKAGLPCDAGVNPFDAFFEELP
jgi:hypothetical protein